MGSLQNDQEKLERLNQLCQKYHLICMLKSEHTAIGFHNRTLWFNNTGNSGMTKAGSGDILPGIIGGL